MIIRDATIEDLPEMSGLWVSMLKETNPEVAPNAEWWKQSQKEMMENRDNMGVHYYPYVAIVNDRMVGFIIGILYSDATASQSVALGQDFYVLPEWRNTSISEGLYGKLVRMGKSLNADCIEMTCFKDQLEFWGNSGYSVQKYCIRRPM
ncbi:GNAT family N-acetyltransferase [Candidatus Pacearchaeota archaeon]|nr:GNAT family N-acetyltransferase [Candidatus Pacearchaeota archaeon]